ncbi:DsbA family protein [Streptomyces sp. NBC_00893]|uniref:DsbA family protein n=1 Tax=Streptomyces sp. NBC_00893 TaxID=2975862 RepID=UPI002253653A|nr:DsbA family protein [Streptomyces sp. NBC_00893]MCX4846505.1 DsbA family protein [Streptomyces sp. NBC_00893]
MPKSSSARKTTPARKPSSRKPVLYGAGVVLAAALLGYVSYQATAPDDPGPSSSSVADVAADPDAGVYPELAKLARRDAGDKLAQGRADAPVVLIEYADFKCGYCGKFARDTEPALVKKYVDNGTLRIEWRNFPIFGAESEAAARAAWAAGQQNRFWQFHAAAYAEGAKEKGFGKDRLKALAREAGVADLDRFARDADSSAASAAVGKDQEQGYGIGATSTPSFLINGRPIAGAQPAETFTRAIEAAAEKARSTEDAKSGQDDKDTEGGRDGKNAEGAGDDAE